MVHWFPTSNCREGKFVSLNDESQKSFKWKTCPSDWLCLYANYSRDDVASLRQKSQETSATLSTKDSEDYDCGLQPFDEGHVERNLVNDVRIRSSSSLKLLARRSDLDVLAEEHARRMASNQAVKHSKLDKVLDGIQSQQHKYEQLGENVGRGRTLLRANERMMEEASNVWNILDSRYTEMGMATAKGKDGKVYICQLFRG